MNTNDSNKGTSFLNQPFPMRAGPSLHGKMKSDQWANLGMNFQVPLETSLISMAAASLFSETRTFQRQPEWVNPLVITSQVLAELADEDLFGPAPSEDIFDLEPVPISEHHHHEQQRTLNMPNRLALLEDTLNQVLNDESDFFSMENSTVSHQPQQQSTNSPAPPMYIHKNDTKRTQDCVSSSEPSFKKQRSEVDISPLPSASIPSGAFSSSQLLEEDLDEKGERFRDYQSKQWSQKFEELIAFKKERGHCCVPHTFKENPPLARWVKRQRYQYKLKNERKPSTMTDERILALEEMGFIWDSHGAAWEERLDELGDYRRTMGHCNVPSNYSSNPQLATWVKCQRRQYKLFWDGKPSNMTLERINKLESFGFAWELRGPKKSKGGEDSNSW